MKKIVALLLAALLAVSCISFAAAEDAITLDVIICQYGPNTQEWFLGSGMNGTNFVAKFEAANPGIKLNLQVVSWNDVYSEVSTRLSNNNAPDILNLDTFADYQTEGLLMPVSDYCSAETYAKFFPAFLEQSKVNDVVWAVPDLASIRPMYYNVDIFKEVGIEVPTTWAELEDACQAIKDYYNGNVYPWGIDMTTDEGQAAFTYYIANNNGKFLDADGNWSLNCPENVQALEFAINLYKKGYTNPNPATQTRYDLQDMFGAGKLAMVIGPNMSTYLKDKGYTVNYADAALPHNEGASVGALGVMDRVMAFKDDTAPDQAARNAAIGKFIDAFYADEDYSAWVTMEGFLPATQAGAEFMVKADPTFQKWLDMVAGAAFYPTAKAEWIDVKQGVINVEQRALQGEDVKTLLDELQAQITKK